MHIGKLKIGRTLFAFMLVLLACGCFSPSVESLRARRYRPDTGNREVLTSKDTSKQGDVPGADLPVPEVGKKNVLKRGDRVIVLLFTRENSPKIEDIIDDRGQISLPLIGKIKVGGMMTYQAEQLIERTYQDEGFYKNIDVSVIKEIEGWYFVRGEVNRPARYPLSGDLTLMRAIATAAGFNPFAKRTKIKIIRGSEIIECNVEKIDVGKEKDPLIKPDDVIIVPKRWI